MNVFSYIGAYTGIGVVMYFGTAYFYPDTFKKFDGGRYPPWSLVSVFWPIPIVYGIGYLISSLNKVILNAGLKRQERRDQKRIRVHATDNNNDFAVEAEQEVEQYLREKSR